MATTSAHTLTLRGVLSESKRIINAHSRHFIALSVLFLLPLSFSLIIFPSLFLPLPQSDVVSTQFNALDFPPIHQTLIFSILCALFVFLLPICALATITYSTLHGLYRRPVKFFSAIKSLIFSFFPLVSTAVAALFFICLISLLFFLFIWVIFKLGQNLGFVIDYNSRPFMLFCDIMLIALGLIVVYFQVNWSLAFVVVVAESKWGFEPLRRSSYLVRGMRTVSVSLMLMFGVLIGLWVWVSSNFVDFDAVGGWSWPFVLQMVVGTGFLMLFLLHNMAANTVLYIYCKALHGEMAIEIAEEFAGVEFPGEYVCLPFDDE